MMPHPQPPIASISRRQSDDPVGIDPIRAGDENHLNARTLPTSLTAGSHVRFQATGRNYSSAAAAGADF